MALLFLLQSNKNCIWFRVAVNFFCISVSVYIQYVYCSVVYFVSHTVVFVLLRLLLRVMTSERGKTSNYAPIYESLLHLWDCCFVYVFLRFELHIYMSECDHVFVILVYTFHQFYVYYEQRFLFSSFICLLLVYLLHLLYTECVYCHFVFMITKLQLCSFHTQLQAIYSYFCCLFLWHPVNENPF